MSRFGMPDYACPDRQAQDFPISNCTTTDCARTRARHGNVGGESGGAWWRWWRESARTVGLFGVPSVSEAWRRRAIRIAVIDAVGVGNMRDAVGVERNREIFQEFPGRRRRRRGDASGARTTNRQVVHGRRYDRRGEGGGGG